MTTEKMHIIFINPYCATGLHLMSYRIAPSDIITLIYDPSEEGAVEKVKQVRDNFKIFQVETEEISMDIFDYYACLLFFFRFFEKITDENTDSRNLKTSNNHFDVVINSSTNVEPATFALRDILSFYNISGKFIFLKRDDQGHWIDKVSFLLPIFNFANFNIRKEHFEILETLYKIKTFDSIELLLSSLIEKYQTYSNYKKNRRAGRKKLSIELKTLSEMGLIKTEKDKKALKIMIPS